jgi:predicted transcriptional regulator
VAVRAGEAQIHQTGIVRDRRARKASRRREGRMRVEEVMSKAKGCREGDAVRDCARMMRDDDIGFVPVCNERGEPVGAVTDRDLAIRVLAEGRGPDEKVDSVMTRDVVACRKDDDVRDVEKLMREHKLSRVMVCDDQRKLLGVVSLMDIAHATSDEEAGETLQRVKSGGPSQPSTH